MDEMARTVLIVEDSDTSADTLEIALLLLPDLNVAHARSGRKAWQLLQREPVSAIITDLHLPHMDGFELIERVRAAAPIACVPIIVVSGDSDPETPDRVRQLGADAYFAKPYSPAAVRETLERLLHENLSSSP
jgi:DNA-binding response OmpR family regulator